MKNTNNKLGVKQNRDHIVVVLEYNNICPPHLFYSVVYPHEFIYVAILFLPRLRLVKHSFIGKSRELATMASQC